VNNPQLSASSFPFTSLRHGSSCLFAENAAVTLQWHSREANLHTSSVSRASEVIDSMEVSMSKPMVPGLKGGLLVCQVCIFLLTVDCLIEHTDDET
jgi:hypothetical protein